MSVIVITSLQELEPYIKAWDDLALNAIESNPCYESWMLIPAMRYLAKGKKLQIVLVIKETPENPPQLIGLFPFVKELVFHNFFFPHYTLWHYPQCLLCTPLVDKDNISECLTQLLTFVDGLKFPICLVRLKLIRGDGPFYQNLLEALAKHGNRSDEAFFDRALLEAQPSLSTEEFMKAAMSPNARHEMRRKRNNLAKLGNVEILNLTSADDVEYWLNTLLNLEDGGWKGKKGTSLIAIPEEKKFYEAAFRSAFKRGQLLAQMMTLDGKPIAILAEFLAADKGALYASKTAFDEDFSKYSPGALLLQSVTEQFLKHQGFEYLDSCAEPNQVMFNRAWKERRLIKHINLSTKNTLSRLIVNLFSKLRKRRSAATLQC
ncbi:MAG: GNAT family N-acetyltransferase [Bdellovibrionota bacterium]|jgi:hypothetical protein